MREAVSFSVVLKSNIWVGEYNTMNQHNCKKISQLRKKCTTAKKIAQQRNSTQESQKKLAQLRKKWHNCETKCTTAKKKAQLRNTFIAVVHFLAILNYRTNSTFHFSFPFLLISTLPRHPSTAVNKLPPADAASHCLSRATSLFYFCYIPLPSGNKPRGASPRRDYEDGISTNRIIQYFYSIMVYIGNDTSKKGGSTPWATD